MKAKLLKSIHGLSPSKIRDNNESTSRRETRSKNRPSFTSYLVETDTNEPSSSDMRSKQYSISHHHHQQQPRPSQEDGSWNIIDDEEVGLHAFFLISILLSLVISSTYHLFDTKIT